jgi:hypothetical protein
MAPPLTLATATHGSQLELVFTNVSAAPVTMTTHVRVGTAWAEATYDTTRTGEGVRAALREYFPVKF